MVTLGSWWIELDSFSWLSFDGGWRHVENSARMMWQSGIAVPILVNILLIN